MARFKTILKMSIPVVVAGMLFSSCKKEPGDDGKVNFDRKAMLVNWADNILLPAYTDLEMKVNMFHHSADSLASQETQASLDLCRQRFKEAYLAFQKIKAFETGPSADISFRAMANTYPTDTAKVLMNGSKTNYELNSTVNIDAKGFPALDYLLFSHHGQLLQDDSLQLYLTRVIDNIHQMIFSIRAGWDNGYRNDFVNASGTDIGSSLGGLVNAINKDYELIKNAKIGFPAGKKTLGKPFPKTCEAYYSGISLDLAEANIEAIHHFYQGIYFDRSQNGPSLQDYLEALDAKHQDAALDQVIDDQFRTALDALRAVPGPFSEAVISYKTEVDAAYLEIQRNVVLLKTDLPSAMGVLITYQDNDGD